MNSWKRQIILHVCMYPVLCGSVHLFDNKPGYLCLRYPVYRIPTGPASNDASASFLTYHSLSALPMEAGIFLANVNCTAAADDDDDADVSYVCIGHIVESHSIINKLHLFTEAGSELHVCDTILQANLLVVTSKCSFRKAAVCKERP